MDPQTVRAVTEGLSHASLPVALCLFGICAMYFGFKVWDKTYTVRAATPAASNGTALAGSMTEAQWLPKLQEQAKVGAELAIDPHLERLTLVLELTERTLHSIATTQAAFGDKVNQNQKELIQILNALNVSIAVIGAKGAAAG